MSYKLIITQRAKDDRNRAFNWYCANYSEEFAAHWYQGIAEAIVRLTRDPMLGHKAWENDRFPLELYELLHGKRMHKHRILYTVEDDLVVVLRIWHSSQRDVTEEDL